MATKKRKVKRYQEGGVTEEEYKRRGLEESRGEKVGFLERLMAGNIDEPGSEAYKRFGAGRGRAAAVPVEDRTFTPVEDIKKAAQEMKEVARSDTSYSDYGDAAPATYTVTPTKVTKEKTEVQTAKPVKPSAGAGRGGQGGPTAQEQKAYRERYGAGRGERGGPTADELNAYRMDQERKRLMGLEQKQALERVTPEEFLGPGTGLKAMHRLAKSLAERAPKLAEYVQPLLTGPKGKELLEGPGNVPRLPAPKRPSPSGSGPASRMESKPGAARREAEAGKRSTRKYNEDEGGMEFKRGGKIKKMASGGSTASRRADGIAVRGKTKGRIY